MKIKFPVLLKYPQQYKQFMEYLDENTDFLWLEGQRPVDFTPPCFPGVPVYICIDLGLGDRKIYYKREDWFEASPNCVREVEIEIEDYHKGEIEFES